MSAEESPMALGIACGELRIAISYKWVKKMVDEFEMVAIPKSPPWLAGLANIDGAMVPVVDLGEFFGSGNAAAPSAASGPNRLLVGAWKADEQEEVIGFLFTGLPTQLHHSLQPVDAPAGLPARLRDLCRGQETNHRGEKFFNLDVDGLSEALLSSI